MEIGKLDNALEALLFVSGDGLKISDIAELLELQKSEINASIKRLKEKYSENCGIHLIVYNNKVQLCSNPDYAEVVSQVLNPIKEKALSNATLETVAIIAYRQPITRLELESIRGVNCDYVVQVLLKHNLIEIVGRKDVIGKPLLYGTTDEFLKRFQIESIKDLPDYEQLLETIKVISMSENDSGEEKGLYHDFELPEEEEMPEFLQGEEVSKVVLE